MGRRTRLTCGGPFLLVLGRDAPCLKVQRKVRLRAVQIRFVVTFYNNTGAMAFKEACEERGVAGELIPIPKQLEAGYGLAWSAPLTVRVTLMAAARRPLNRMV